MSNRLILLGYRPRVNG